MVENSVSLSSEHSSPSTPDAGERLEHTQTTPFAVNDGTMADSATAQQARQTQAHASCWGYLARGEHKFQLRVREARDGRVNAHVLGRNLDCDIVVNDRRVSGKHCIIYCEYESIMARMRVYVEDTSQNGTYVNGMETRLRKGQRYELKSGDELFLSRPNRSETLAESHFIFVNTRERDIIQRNVLAAQSCSEGTDRGDDSQDSKLDKYEIGPQIGLGTCGTVHTCREHATGNQYAIKIVDLRKLTLAAGGASISELAAEAEIMRSLNHPNIITVHDSWQTSQAIYIVMELVRGGDLFERVVQRTHYSEDNARTLMRALLSAVKYLHDKGIVHRDLKPENILLTDPYDDVSIKITDFGLAKRISEEGLKTFCGTPQYFAPEVLKRRTTVHGKGRYGTAADMWSVGVVLYVLLTGTPPFDENRLFNQIEQADICLQGPEWWGVSDSAKHLVRSLLTIDPRERLTVDQALQHPWTTNSPFSTETFYATMKRQLSTTKFSSAHPLPDEPAEPRVQSAPAMKAPAAKKRRRTTTSVASSRPSLSLEIVQIDTSSTKRPHKRAPGPLSSSVAGRDVAPHSGDDNGGPRDKHSQKWSPWQLIRETPLPRKPDATEDSTEPGAPLSEEISEFSDDEEEDDMPRRKRTPPPEPAATANENVTEAPSEAAATATSAESAQQIKLKKGSRVVRKQQTLGSLFFAAK